MWDHLRFPHEQKAQTPIVFRHLLRYCNAGAGVRSLLTTTRRTSVHLESSIISYLYTVCRICVWRKRRGRTVLSHLGQSLSIGFLCAKFYYCVNVGSWVISISTERASVDKVLAKEKQPPGIPNSNARNNKFRRSSNVGRRLSRHYR